MQSEKKDLQENQQKLQLDRDRYISDHTHHQLAGTQCRLTLLKEKLGPYMRAFLQSRLSEQVSGLERQLFQLKTGVQRELNDGGYRLGPVKSRLQEMLEDFTIAPSSIPRQQSQQPNMLPLPGMTPQPASLLTAPQPVSWLQVSYDAQTSDLGSLSATVQTTCRHKSLLSQTQINR